VPERPKVFSVTVLTGSCSNPSIRISNCCNLRNSYELKMVQLVKYSSSFMEPKDALLCSLEFTVDFNLTYINPVHNVTASFINIHFYITLISTPRLF
jgi:hypothetical protein